MVAVLAGVGILVKNEPEVEDSLLFGMEDLRPGIISPSLLPLASSGFGSRFITGKTSNVIIKFLRIAS